MLMVLPRDSSLPPPLVETTTQDDDFAAVLQFFDVLADIAIEHPEIVRQSREALRLSGARD